MSLISRLHGSNSGPSGTDNAQATRGRYALVISGSPVNRVVVCRILQDSGIRPIAVDVSAAPELLSAAPPRLIVAESSREPERLKPLLDMLSKMAAAGSAPPVIYLAGTHGSGLPDFPFSEVVKMPIAPESFRPLIAKYL